LTREARLKAALKLLRPGPLHRAACEKHLLMALEFIEQDKIGRK
jgi:hypothetical protein